MKGSTPMQGAPLELPDSWIVPGVAWLGAGGKRPPVVRRAPLAGVARQDACSKGGDARSTWNATRARSQLDA